MLRIFSGMTGWTSLLPWDGELREPYVSELQKYGIEVLPYAPKLRGLEHRGTDFYDIVLISRPHVAEEFLAAVRKRFPGATVIYDTVDLHHLRYSRKRDTVGLGALDEERGVDVDEIRRAEVKCFHASDIVAVVTEAEASIIQELAPTSHAVVLPTVHPIPTEPLPGYDGRTGILFIGSYQHDPNVDAVMYFARQIFPEIAARIDAQFFVLGADPPAEVLALQSPRIVVTGYLPSVDEYFLRAKVFVAPMRYGAGMKGKIGHALAFGVPVVTSSVGAEGMDLADADAALIRDEPNEFGAAVLGLYEDAELWRRLSRRGQEVVRERWTPDVMARRLEALLTDLAGLKAA
jgi:glycosyltransferase involved in cell wall biosynthesis